MHRHFLRGPSGAIGSTTTRTKKYSIVDPESRKGIIAPEKRT
jgi:hypothetical protein